MPVLKVVERGNEEKTEFLDKKKEEEMKKERIKNSRTPRESGNLNFEKKRKFWTETGMVSKTPLDLQLTSSHGIVPHQDGDHITISAPCPPSLLLPLRLRPSLHPRSEPHSPFLPPVLDTLSV